MADRPATGLHGYQLYRITAVHFSIALTLLTIFDAVLVWLTWREYQAKRTRRHPDKPPLAAGK
jgi:uncharacterized membrane protein